MTDKMNVYEVKVTVAEYYQVEATSELGAMMKGCEDPYKIIEVRRTIKKIPKLKQ